ncbi:hypothetical protein K438DRAFT_1754179 [Mycena galopus ATCC 62051]|nr:hypothetical protein K438DRAFT_1754179 [Mycena galopus ATCC 62051]
MSGGIVRGHCPTTSLAAVPRNTRQNRKTAVIANSSDLPLTEPSSDAGAVESPSAAGGAGSTPGPPVPLGSGSLMSEGSAIPNLQTVSNSSVLGTSGPGNIEDGATERRSGGSPPNENSGPTPAELASSEGEERPTPSKGKEHEAGYGRGLPMLFGNSTVPSLTSVEDYQWDGVTVQQLLKWVPYQRGPYLPGRGYPEVNAILAPEAPTNSAEQTNEHLINSAPNMPPIAPAAVPNLSTNTIPLMASHWTSYNFRNLPANARSVTSNRGTMTEPRTINTILDSGAPRHALATSNSNGGGGPPSSAPLGSGGGSPPNNGGGGDAQGNANGGRNGLPNGGGGGGGGPNAGGGEGLIRISGTDRGPVLSACLPGAYNGYFTCSSWSVHNFPQTGCISIHDATATSAGSRFTVFPKVTAFCGFTESAASSAPSDNSKLSLSSSVHLKTPQDLTNMPSLSGRIKITRSMFSPVVSHPSSPQTDARSFRDARKIFLVLNIFDLASIG